MSHVQSTARVREVRKPQNMFCSPAPYTVRKHGHSIDPEKPHLQKSFSDPKEDLLQTTNFSNTIQSDV